MRPMRTTSLLTLAIAIAGCGESGACIQKISQDGAGYSFCKEIEHASECPVQESGDDGDEFRFEFQAGDKCKKHGYEFDCGDGVFEDVETECVSEE